MFLEFKEHRLVAALVSSNETLDALTTAETFLTTTNKDPLLSNRIKALTAGPTTTQMQRDLMWT